MLTEANLLYQLKGEKHNMKFLKSVIKELLKTKGIKQPYKYLGEIEYDELYNKTRSTKTKQRATMSYLAKKLDVPASFIKRIIEYERIDE